MASAIVILTIRDAQGQLGYRAYSSTNSETPVDVLAERVRQRFGIADGMALRWIHGGFILEVNAMMSPLSHANRDQVVWFAVKPNGGIAQDINIWHTQADIQDRIANRGEGWHSASAQHVYIDPVN